MTKNIDFEITSVNLSKERGAKYPVIEITLDLNGVKGDVHAGTIRPVSILGTDHIDLFKKLTGSRDFNYGEFAENITVNGMGNLKTSVFDSFQTRLVELEIIKIGKPFHDKFRVAGNYLMPKIGIFCRVKKQGKIKPGDILSYHPKIFQILIITLSDRASKGEYEDKSGPKIKELTESFFNKIEWKYKIKSLVIPDNPEELKSLLKQAKHDNTDIVITTGGTGIGPRDFTPEVVKSLIDKEIPGIMEMIRFKYGQENPNALLSRGIAGVMNQTLIYALPGSVKAVNEYMNEIVKTLQHIIFMLHDIKVH